MTISRYEVELQVTDRHTGVKSIQTRLEHAYSLSDAIVQALHALTYSLGDLDVKDIKMVRCGPPMEDIRRAESQWLQMVSTLSDLAGAKPATVKR